MRNVALIVSIIMMMFIFISAGSAEYQIGDTVEDFVLPDCYGEDIHLYDFQGQSVLLVFFSEG